MVEEKDSLFDENRRICGGDLDDQGCAELGDSVRALPIAMPVDRCTASAMAFWRRAGSEGRAETGTRIIRRESEAGAGRNASYELFSGAMCCWVTLASWS